MPHSMCYSHYSNGVRNGVISIAQWGLLGDCYKVNPISQCGKILVIVMEFVDMFRPCLLDEGIAKLSKKFKSRNNCFFRAQQDKENSASA